MKKETVEIKDTDIYGPSSITIEGKTFKIARPVGHWCVTDAWPHKVYCSECYKTFAQSNWEVWKDGSLPRNFCPHCGARMEQ